MQPVALGLIAGGRLTWLIGLVIVLLLASAVVFWKMPETGHKVI